MSLRMIPRPLVCLSCLSALIRWIYIYFEMETGFIFNNNSVSTWCVWSYFTSSPLPHYLTFTQWSKIASVTLMVNPALLSFYLCFLFNFSFNSTTLPFPVLLSSLHLLHCPLCSVLPLCGCPSVLQALAQAIKEAKEQHPDMSVTRVVVHKETELAEEEDWLNAR